MESCPVMLFFALWEFAARFGRFSAVEIFPPFSTVLLEIIRLFNGGIMTRNITDTLVRVLLGLCIGVSGGVIVGILMGWRRVIGRSLSPVIAILYPIPALAGYPL
jgi:NitT/TauT family transport system permease protein